MKNVFERVGEFEIIDFHTHPFTVNNNICAYRTELEMHEEDMIPTLQSVGISRMCGSIIQTDDRDSYPTVFEKQSFQKRSIFQYNCIDFLRLKLLFP